MAVCYHSVQLDCASKHMSAWKLWFTRLKLQVRTRFAIWIHGDTCTMHCIGSAQVDMGTCIECVHFSCIVMMFTWFSIAGLMYELRPYRGSKEPVPVDQSKRRKWKKNNVYFEGPRLPYRIPWSIFFFNFHYCARYLSCVAADFSQNNSML